MKASRYTEMGVSNVCIEYLSKTALRTEVPFYRATYVLQYSKLLELQLLLFCAFLCSFPTFPATTRWAASVADPVWCWRPPVPWFMDRAPYRSRPCCFNRQTLRSEWILCGIFWVHQKAEQKNSTETQTSLVWYNRISRKTIFTV